jgi:hypothetical protein
VSNTVQAGVGVFFQQESDGNVYVKTIVSGGAAERDGLIQIGDIIVAVDDREVRIYTSDISSSILRLPCIVFHPSTRIFTDDAFCHDLIISNHLPAAGHRRAAAGPAQPHPRAAGHHREADPAAAGGRRGPPV